MPYAVDGDGFRATILSIAGLQLKPELKCKTFQTTTRRFLLIASPRANCHAQNAHPWRHLGIPSSAEAIMRAWLLALGLALLAASQHATAAADREQNQAHLLRASVSPGAVCASFPMPKIGSEPQNSQLPVPLAGQPARRFL